MAKWRILLASFLSRPGLPLFELILGFMICSMAYVAWVGGVFHFDERSKAGLNSHRMVILNMCLQAYHWGNSVWPPDLGVLACEGRDRRTCIPHAAPEALRDPWGTPYLYKASPEGFMITSLGADKKEGGEGPDADVTEDGP